MENRLRRFLQIFKKKGRHPLEERVGYRFKNPELLRQALSHRSWVYANDSGRSDSNERMEFLGDAVLDLLITDYIYGKYPRKQEGDLSEMKSLIVSKKVLFKAAEKLDLGKHLFLSASEEKSGGRNRMSIVADAYEALLAAVYLDSGIQSAREFVQMSLVEHLDAFMDDAEHVNYKSQLLEIVQGQHLGMPNYNVISEKGPDHDKIFEISVQIGEAVWGSGTGRNKKEAEQEAARDALNHKDEKINLPKRREA